MAITLNRTITKAPGGRLYAVDVRSTLEASTYFFGTVGSPVSGHSRYMSHSNIPRQAVAFNETTGQYELNINRAEEDAAFATALETARQNAIAGYLTTSRDSAGVLHWLTYHRVVEATAVQIREWAGGYTDTVTVTEIAMADGLSLVGNVLALDVVK